MAGYLLDRPHISANTLLSGTKRNSDSKRWKGNTGHTKFYWQKADCENYSAAKTCYNSWKRTDDSEAGTKSSGNKLWTLKNYPQALRSNQGTSNVCPFKFQNHYEPMSPFCLSFSPFEQERLEQLSYDYFTIVCWVSRRCGGGLRWG